jgi:hypothetical protein
MMDKVEGYFDELHWTESNIKKVIISAGEKSIKLWVEFLEIFPPHPFFKVRTSNETFIAVFENVHTSSLDITEYIGDAREGRFKPKITKQDVFRDGKESDCGKDYSLEGVLLDDCGRKHAWITWDIVAEKFSLERESK